MALLRLFFNNQVEDCNTNKKGAGEAKKMNRQTKIFAQARRRAQSRYITQQFQEL
jgi:hypothetical protein